MRRLPELGFSKSEKPNLLGVRTTAPGRTPEPLTRLTNPLLGTFDFDFDFSCCRFFILCESCSGRTGRRFKNTILAGEFNEARGAGIRRFFLPQKNRIPIESAG
ncbi:hypothetical protein Zmor_000320 [Zophobas morio]|uniref:Uncharacterized protein n=1 Tax=Zophobas morio TaxID=2755281 RepID=A0AA38MR56_9CUCU|nr:hypothetical protein Zmor_000320 [Zophobas morio]